MDRLSSQETADWCRDVAATLRAGVPIVQALKRASGRGSPRVRRASEALLASLRGGEDIAGAIEENRDRFAPLFVSMAKVGVQSGHLPEILRELERYFRYQVSLYRMFVTQITWPAFQLGMAIGVIALVIYLLGVLPATDILGLGLRGPSGALVWLGIWVGIAAFVWSGYTFARNQLGKAELIDRLLLRVPVVGKALQTLAVARLTMAMHLTLETGMSLRRAVPLSLEASDNAVFASLGRPIVESIRAGHSLSESFAEHGVFPREMLDVLASAEESGRIPEAMEQLSAEYSERAEHQMALLNQAAGWVVWIIVASILIFFIFRIAMKAYIGPMYDALEGRF